MMIYPNKIYFKLRDYTTFSFGVTLPFAGLHYPKLRDYTTLKSTFFKVFSKSKSINCGITLPCFSFRKLSISYLKFIGCSSSNSKLRDCTTFCGIALPLAGLHYPIFRDYTILPAGLHYLNLRDYTTPEKKGIQLHILDYKAFIPFFYFPIKLYYKTPLNYLIKHIRASLPFRYLKWFSFENAGYCT